MTAFLLANVIGLLVLHAVGLGLLLRNLRWLAWPADQRRRPSGELSVTAIVPARNEADDVGRCLRSLLAQDYPKLKVIAINDHSTDDTPQIMDKVAAEDERLTVIHNPPLQPGWLGKHNAMQAGLANVQSELVLFSDGDIHFAPTCLSVAVAEIETRQLDFFSVYPQFEFVTFCETILVPIYVGAFAMVVSPTIEDPRSRRALAIGSFILVRTERLREVDGFARIKATILDDVGLACVFKEQGFRISLRSAPDLMRVRFFKTCTQALFGNAKHLLGIVQGRLWLAPLLAVLPLYLYVMLLWGVVYGILVDQWLLTTLSLVTLGIHYVALLLSKPLNKFNPFVALAFPLMSISFAASCLRAAYLLMVRHKFEWRGRNTVVGVGENEINKVRKS